MSLPVADGQQETATVILMQADSWSCIWRASTLDSGDRSRLHGKHTIFAESRASECMGVDAKAVCLTQYFGLYLQALVLCTTLRTARFMPSQVCQHFSDSSFLSSTASASGLAFGEWVVDHVKDKIEFMNLHY